MELQTKLVSLLVLFVILYPIFKYIYHTYIKSKNEYDVYVINMRKDKKRFKKISKELNKQNIKFRKIEGVNGGLLNKELLAKNKIISKNYDEQLSLPKVGCSWSHKKTWLHAYKDQNSYNDIIVIEDNADISHKFKSKLDKLAYELRDIQYDICYLGRKPLLEDYKSEERKLSNNVTTTSKSEGTYGYIINRNSLSKMIKEYNKLDNKPDELWNNGKFDIVSSSSFIVNK